MILDSIANRERYSGLGSRITAALDFLAQPGTATLEPAATGTTNSLRIPLQGDAIFALIQRYETKSPTEAFWEAHRQYVDVQYVVEGVERMGHAPLETMQISQPYDEVKDSMVLAPRSPEQSLNYFRVEAGMFAIFMPHDAHMPGLAVNGVPSIVKKAVLKVRVED